jgi:uncharacterized protein (DUF58 family)
VFLAATVLVTLVALSSQLAILFVFAGGMVGALYISEVVSRRMVAHVAVVRRLGRRCRQHEQASVQYDLRCDGRGPTALALRVAEDGRVGQLPPAWCPHLPGGAARRAVSQFTPRRRGRLVLTGVTLSTSFPLGLTTARRRHEQAAEWVVWPARGRLKVELFAHGAAYEAGGAPSGRAGGQDEFYGVREYRAGDSPRWIHWRRSAGRAQPVVREMSRPQPQAVWVVLDTQMSGTSSACDERRERAIRLAATVVEDALAAGYRVALAYGATAGPAAVRASSAPGQRERLLDSLAGIGANARCSLAGVLGYVGAARLRHARVIVIRLAWNDPPPREVLPMRHGSSGAVTVIDDDRLEEVFEDADARASPAVQGSRQQAAGSREEAAGSRQQGRGSRQRAAGKRQQAAGSREEAAGSRQQGRGSRQQAAGKRQQAAGSREEGGEGRPDGASSSVRSGDSPTRRPPAAGIQESAHGQEGSS